MADNKSSRNVTWGKRIALVLLVLAGMFYGVLNLAEKSKDSMRLGLQDYISDATGHSAEITSMTTVELTPDLIFRMNGVTLRDKSDSTKTLMSIQKAYFGTPFLHMMTGRQNYIGMEIQNAEIASGYLFPKKIEISFAGISDTMPGKKPAVFLLEGRYNGKDVLLTLDLVRKAAKKNYLYALPSSSPFTFKMGDIEAMGVLEQSSKGLSLLNVAMTKGNDTANFNINHIRNNPVSGTLDGEVNSAGINGSLIKLGNTISLSISSQDEDQKTLKQIISFLEAIKEEIAIQDNEAGFEIKFNQKN